MFKLHEIEFDAPEAKKRTQAGMRLAGTLFYDDGESCNNARLNVSTMRSGRFGLLACQKAIWPQFVATDKCEPQQLKAKKVLR